MVWFFFVFLQRFVRAYKNREKCLRYFYAAQTCVQNKKKFVIQSPNNILLLSLLILVRKKKKKNIYYIFFRSWKITNEKRANTKYYKIFKYSYRIIYFIVLGKKDFKFYFKKFFPWHCPGAYYAFAFFADFLIASRTSFAISNRKSEKEVNSQRHKFKAERKGTKERQRDMRKSGDFKTQGYWFARGCTSCKRISLPNLWRVLLVALSISLSLFLSILSARARARLCTFVSPALSEFIGTRPNTRVYTRVRFRYWQCDRNVSTVSVDEPWFDAVDESRI